MISARRTVIAWLGFALVHNGAMVSARSQSVVSPRSIVWIEPFRWELASAFEPTIPTLERHCYYVASPADLIGTAVGGVKQRDIIYALKSTSGSLLLYQSHGDEGIIWGESFATESAAQEEKEHLVEFLYANDEDLAISQIGPAGTWTIGLRNSFTSNQVMARDVAVIASCYGSTTGNFNASCKLGGVGECGDAVLRQDWACLVGWMEKSVSKTFSLAALYCGSLDFQIDSGNWQLFTALDGQAPDCEHTWGWMKGQYTGYREHTGVGVFSAAGNTIAWNHLPGDSERTYTVFRSTWDNSDLALIGSTLGDSLFVDEDVMPGVQYTYHVCSEDSTILTEVVNGEAGLKLIGETTTPDPAHGIVNALVVHRNRAYLSFSHTIQKYDISDPSNLVLMASRTDDVFGSSVNRMAVSEDGTTLYILTQTGFVVLDATTPGLAVLDMIGNIVTGSWADYEGTVGLAVDGDIVYASFGGKGLYAFDVSHPHVLKVAGIYDPTPETAFAAGVEIVGDYLYLSVPDGSSSSLWRAERLTVEKELVPAEPYDEWHVSFAVDCTSEQPGCLADGMRFPAGFSSKESKGALGLGWDTHDGFVVVSTANSKRLSAIKAVEPKTNTPGLVFTDPFGAPVDTLSFISSIDDYDFDSRFMYATTPMLFDPFGRSLVAFDAWSGEQQAIYAAGDTLGDVLPGEVQSQGRYVYVAEDFKARGAPEWETRLRVYEKANGCKPDPDKPVRLFPDEEAFHIGDEIAVTWAIGCPTSATIELVEDGQVAQPITVESYPFPDDIAYVTRWAVTGSSSDPENHVYQVRVTATYDDQASATYWSAPFRIEVGNRIEVSATGGLDYTTIHAAVAAAASGDTVLVHPGTYAEQVVLKSNVRVMGMPGVVLRSGFQGRSMVADSLVHRPTVDGIRFEGSSGSINGGLRVEDCGILLSNCEFAGIERAVEIDNGYGEIVDCAFSGNHDPVGGGALWINLGSSGSGVTIEGCTFESNTSDAYGACVWISSEATYSEAAPQVSFNQCEFIGNSAVDDAVVRIGSYTRPTFAECTFTGNATGSGGSIVGGVSAGAYLQNCTLVSNTGGASFAVVGVTPFSGMADAVAVDRCIISHNATGSALEAVGGPEYLLTGCDFFGNAANDATWAAQGTDCFSADPAYCGAGSYALMSSSPCIPGINTSHLVGAHGIGCSPPAVLELIGGLDVVAPDTLLFGCPGGDGDSLAVRIDFDNGLTRSLGKTELDLAPPYSTRGIWTVTPIVASEPVVGPDFVTTLRWKYLSGAGIDSFEVRLNGYPLATTHPIHRRGPDLDDDGVVGLSDLAAFGADYESPPKPYNSRSDFNGTGTVGIGDFGLFGQHVNHTHPFGTQALSPDAVHSSSASVVLRFEESDPLSGEHRMRAHLTMENPELFKAALIALESENPVFEFVEWHPNPAYPQVTMGTKTQWNGKSVVMIGALGSKNQQSTYVSLGHFDVVVHSDTPTAPSDQDYRLLLGDLLEVGGGTLTIDASSVRRAYSAPVYRNHLAQNYPNPFNPSTTIAFSLEAKARASLVIYDVRGARVRTLVDGDRERGNHRVVWQGDNDRGSQVASGVYFYRLRAGSFHSSRKMVLLR